MCKDNSRTSLEIFQSWKPALIGLWNIQMDFIALKLMCIYLLFTNKKAGFNEWFIINKLLQVIL